MYASGYRFRVSAKYQDGKLIALPRIFNHKFSDRDSVVDSGIEIQDNELCEVIRNDNGAVYVCVARTGQKGYLG